MSTPPPLPPDMQRELANLFDMFSAYVAARTSREKQDLHNQILTIFSRLGVVSDSLLFRQAAETFERISRVQKTSKLPESTLAAEARVLVNARIRLFENTPNNPSLSNGARQFLRIPIVEAAEMEHRFDANQAASSLETVLTSLQAPPTNRTEGTGQTRTSVAVIRAFWKTFCRIPPFCSGRAQE